MQNFHNFNQIDQELAVKELVYSRILKTFFAQTAELARNLDTLGFEVFNQIIVLAQESNLIPEFPSAENAFIRKLFVKKPSLIEGLFALNSFWQELKCATLNYTNFVQSKEGCSCHEFYNKYVAPLMEQLSDDLPKNLMSQLTRANFELIKNDKTKPSQTFFYKMFKDGGLKDNLADVIDTLRDEVNQAQTFVEAFVSNILNYTDVSNAFIVVDELSRLAIDTFNEKLSEFYKLDDAFNSEINFNQALFADTYWSQDEIQPINLKGKRFLRLEEQALKLKMSDTNEITLSLAPDILEQNLETELFDELELVFQNFFWRYPSLQTSLSRVENNLAIDFSKSKMSISEDESLPLNVLSDQYFDFIANEASADIPEIYAFIRNEYKSEQSIKVSINPCLVDNCDELYLENTICQASELMSELIYPWITINQNKLLSENYDVSIRAATPNRFISFGINADDFDYLHRYSEMFKLNLDTDYHAFYKSINFEISGLVLKSPELHRLFKISRPMILDLGSDLDYFWENKFKSSALTTKYKQLLLPTSQVENELRILSKKYLKCFEAGLIKVNELIESVQNSRLNRLPVKLTCKIADPSDRNKLILDFAVNIKIDTKTEIERTITVSDDGGISFVRSLNH